MSHSVGSFESTYRCECVSEGEIIRLSGHSCGCVRNRLEKSVKLIGKGFEQSYRSESLGKRKIQGGCDRRQNTRLGGSNCDK
jgi:hypothetical protein